MILLISKFEIINYRIEFRQIDWFGEEIIQTVLKAMNFRLQVKIIGESKNEAPVNLFFFHHLFDQRSQFETLFILLIMNNYWNTYVNQVEEVGSISTKTGLLSLFVYQVKCLLELEGLVHLYGPSLEDLF